MSKIREKESLECGRMHIWALKTQKLPGPFSGPWTPAANCSLRSRDSASLRRQLSASAPGAPPLTKSWIRTWVGRAPGAPPLDPPLRVLLCHCWHSSVHCCNDIPADLQLAAKYCMNMSFKLRYFFFDPWARGRWIPKFDREILFSGRLF